MHFYLVSYFHLNLPPTDDWDVIGLMYVFISNVPRRTIAMCLDWCVFSSQLSADKRLRCYWISVCFHLNRPPRDDWDLIRITSVFHLNRPLTDDWDEKGITFFFSYENWMTWILSCSFFLFFLIMVFLLLYFIILGFPLYIDAFCDYIPAHTSTQALGLLYRMAETEVFCDTGILKVFCRMVQPNVNIIQLDMYCEGFLSYGPAKREYNTTRHVKKDRHIWRQIFD
jgi:hypothetical protein